MRYVEQLMKQYPQDTVAPWIYRAHEAFPNDVDAVERYFAKLSFENGFITNLEYLEKLSKLEESKI